MILQYRSPVDHDSQAIVVMGDVSVTKRIRVDAVTDLLLLIKEALDIRCFNWTFEVGTSPNMVYTRLF